MTNIQAHARPELYRHFLHFETEINDKVLAFKDFDPTTHSILDQENLLPSFISVVKAMPKPELSNTMTSYLLNKVGCIPL